MPGSRRTVRTGPSLSRTSATRSDSTPPPYDAASRPGGEWRWRKASASRSRATRVGTRRTRPRILRAPARGRMPDIGFYHPIVIHFAIGLLAAGVLFRWMSLTGRAAFAGPAAASLSLLATAAILVAAQSGEDAHVAVEAVPRAARAVRAHEEWGERTRNLAVAVGALELLALALRRRPSARRVGLASAGAGAAGCLSLPETAKLRTAR